MTFSWDIPLLNGYEHEFCNNVSKDPGTHHFYGIDLPDLQKAIESWHADAVLFYGWCYKAHLDAMRYFRGRIPVLFRGDSTLIDDRRGLRQILRRCYLMWIYRHVNLALYVGENNRRYFEKHGLRSSQLVFAPHAIDNERFGKSGIDNCNQSFVHADIIRQTLGVHDDQVLILFVGKFETKKAPDLLINAFNAAKNENTHLIMIGSGELQEKLESFGGRNIHFVGFKNQVELPDWYRAADIVVLPSRGPGETWGLALNEAMACGRAVIATDRVGAAIDLIDPGANGWICKGDDQASLVESLNRAIDKGRGRLLEMGTISKRIIDNWSIPQQVDAIATAVINAVKDHDRRH